MSDELSTPVLVVDAAVAVDNVRRMAGCAAAHGLKLRPHTKTHMCRWVAQMRLAAGAPRAHCCQGRRGGGDGRSFRRPPPSLPRCRRPARPPGDRQFSDAQTRLLAGRGAVIGVVCDQWMLTPGYKPGESPRVASLAALADQIDHICQVTGSVRHAAIGSDLDGGFGNEQSPSDLETIADLCKLEPILRGRGYSDADLDAVFFDNWLRFFLKHLP